MNDHYRDDATRYALRGIDGTDLLAFRAFADRSRSVRPVPPEVVDLGCGSGRSTRFLRALGFDPIGVDVSAAMVAEARRLDPRGRYLLGTPGVPLPIDEGSAGMVFSSWAILEQLSPEALLRFARETARMLAPAGLGFIVTNTAAFYAGRWISCDVDFPENRPPLVSGQTVKVRLLPENVTISDVFWSDEDYRRAFADAGLDVVATLFPTADDDARRWLDETHVAPYALYEIRKRSSGAAGSAVVPEDRSLRT